MEPNDNTNNYVYMVFYNYSDFDYQTIKLFNKKYDAYNYICKQHDHLGLPLKMVTPKTPHELYTLNLEDGDTIKICLVNFDKYHKFDTGQYENISQYLIVPIKLE